MRKNLLFIAIAMLFLTFNSYSQGNSVESCDKSNQADISSQKPNPHQVLGAKAMWDIAFTFNAAAPTHAGIETDGINFYTSSWKFDKFSRYTMDGTFVDSFIVAGVSNIRDLTYDGTYFYGSDVSMTIYIIDLANETLIGTIPVTCTGVSAVRHIAYDPTLDGGNGGFWIGNWSELGAITKTGAELVASTNILNGCFGMAYDPHSDPANPCLWLFQQEGGTKAVFSQFDINTMSMTSVTHDCSDVPGYVGGGGSGIAGGACIYTSGGVAYLVGNIQQSPNLIVVYELINSGIETLENSTLTIYPNPNKGNFNLDFSNINGKVNYQIIDTKGSIILSESSFINSNVIKEVSLNLVSGVYFVKVVTETQTIIEKLVVE